MSGARGEGPQWLAVRVRPAGDRDAVTAALFAVGSMGVHDAGEELRTHLPEGTDASAVREALRAADPDAQVDTEWVPSVDWSEAWKHGIGAHTLGRITIAPPWLAADHDPATTIVIDPGMAFGTGEHPTTRGVIRLMQAVVRDGDTVADLGAGSAVLSIAAAKLGAARVAAIEIDADAIPNAEENVAANGVADRVTVIEGDAEVLLPLVAPVQLILANIISSVLVQILPAMGDALAGGGNAILSGILFEERDPILQVLEASGWTLEAEDHEGIWWSATVARR